MLHTFAAGDSVADGAGFLCKPGAGARVFRSCFCHLGSGPVAQR